MAGGLLSKERLRAFSADKGIQYCIFALFFLIFLPILFCVAVFGASMDYNEVCKLITLCDNKVLIIIGIVAVLLYSWVYYILGKVSVRTGIVALGLLIAFTAVYFINVEICKCIWMEQGWDVSCVTGTARTLAAGYPIGDESYFAIYSNNVPITYFLAEIYKKAQGMADYNYNNDFLWIQTICMMISVAGYLCCLAVKRLTDNLAAVLLAFILYVGCVCVTPWKTAPYTDMYAILFPILALSIYVFCRYEKNIVKKSLLWCLLLISAVMGTLMKPTVMVVLIAIVIMELVHDLTHFRSQWKLLAVKSILLVGAIVLFVSWKNHIYEDAGYQVNENAAVTFHHYLLMGLNEDTTGGYNSDVLAFHGRFSTPEERIPAQWEAIEEAFASKGVSGYIDFILRKMVMTFNDGAFGWGREGGFSYDTYPALTDASYVGFMREIFWPDYKYCGRFNTYSQLIWLTILIGIPGICFYKKNDSHLVATIVLAILGIILYLVLFEARARYLICFLPVFVLAASVGITCYCEWILDGVAQIGQYRRKQKNKIR